MTIATEPESASKPESTFRKIVRLLRWDKPAGRLILMLPALWSLVLASRSLDRLPPVDLLLVTVIGALATSAAGCVVNDLWDRDIDDKVERTKQRPLAARSLSIRVGIAVLVVATLCAFALATYLTPLSFLLCFAAVPIIAIYPACKRVFPVPQLVLSLAWGFAVLIPWAAVTGNLSAATWALWGAVVAWTMGFDTVYALSDRPDDLRIGIQSSAIFFGGHTPEAIAAFYGLAAGLLLYLGWDLRLGYVYFVTMAIAVGIWGWHYRQLRQSEIPPSAFPQMFRQNVWIGALVLGGMTISPFLAMATGS